MKTPMLFTLLSFTQLLLITILPPASADLVDDTCKKTPNVDFCSPINDSNEYERNAATVASSIASSLL
ncbi:hypothetical protein ACJRO7_032560 [Eucalyptus globulus]|uniref:Uncharacterized protein n=1 Tax=Eucalyptus globulus TaxID=34317 RepID=A0ABD3JLJ8_EUCGL